MIYPLANMEIIKDLVSDLTHLFAQYTAIELRLEFKTPIPERERLQSYEERSEWLLRMYPLLLLHIRVPEPLVERANSTPPSAIY